MKIQIKRRDPKMGIVLGLSWNRKNISAASKQERLGVRRGSVEVSVKGKIRLCSSS